MSPLALGAMILMAVIAVAYVFRRRGRLTKD